MGLTAYNRVFFGYLASASYDMGSFKNEFPSMKYTNFLELVDGLLEKIASEIADYSEGLSPEEQVELNDFPEYRLLLEKQKYCLVRKQEYLETLKEQKENKVSPLRNIIFAKTPVGNPCLMQDLKTIYKENYDKFLNTLERLRNNDRDFNSEKQKPMNGDGCLNGLYEIKDRQFRLIYMVINKDTVLAIMAEDNIKDTSSLKKTRQPFERKLLVSKQVKKYQEQLKDPVLREQILAENEEIYQRLVSELSKGRKV